MIDNYKLYCFTNMINGKQYIGITKQDINKRWRNGKGYKKSTRIGSAIAEKELNISHHIWDCLRGKRNKCGGYHWKYAKEMM